MLRRELAIAVMVAAAAASHVAHAGDQVKAEQYFRAGEAAFRAQSFGAAAEQFEQAYREDPLPPIAFSAAQAYRKQYEIEPKPEYVKRAVELYRSYLDAVKTGHRVGDAVAGLEEMKRELDRLTASGVKISTVVTAHTRLAVSVTVAGDKQAKQEEMTEMSSAPVSDSMHAQATLDGKPVELFTPVDVVAGDHTVAVTADGFQPQTVTRRVVDGVTELVELELHAKPARLAITGEDDAHVAINGRPAGTLPLPPQELAAGSYLIGITRRGREPIVEQVELKRGEDHAVAVTLHRTWRRRAVPWLAITGGVLAVVAGGSTVLALHYDSEMQAIETRRLSTGISQADLASYRTDTTHRDDYRDVAWAVGGTAVAVGAVAALFYYFDTPAIGEHAIVPTVAPEGAGGGLSVVGRF